MAPADERDEATVADTADRREFLSRAGRGTVAVAAIGLGVAALRFARPAGGAQASRARLGSPADFRMGTLTWLAEEELFVLRREIGVAVFSSRCTHLGCTVRRVADGFVCPCHGATYDPLGQVTRGPARAPLPWYAVSLGEDGRLWADRDRTLTPGTFTPLGEGEPA